MMTLVDADRAFFRAAGNDSYDADQIVADANSLTMTGSGNLEPLGGGYSLDVIRDEDGQWYGVLFDASGLDVWETCPLADAGEVRAAAQAALDKIGRSK